MTNGTNAIIMFSLNVNVFIIQSVSWRTLSLNCFSVIIGDKPLILFIISFSKMVSYIRFSAAFSSSGVGLCSDAAIGFSSCPCSISGACSILLNTVVSLNMDSPFEKSSISSPGADSCSFGLMKGQVLALWHALNDLSLISMSPVACASMSRCNAHLYFGHLPSWVLYHTALAHLMQLSCCQYDIFMSLANILSLVVFIVANIRMQFDNLFPLTMGVCFR